MSKKSISVFFRLFCNEWLITTGAASKEISPIFTYCLHNSYKHYCVKLSIILKVELLGWSILPFFIEPKDLLPWSQRPHLQPISILLHPVPLRSISILSFPLNPTIKTWKKNVVHVCLEFGRHLDSVKYF
jgi:hypothetical protein